jgi:ketosteroid isomerase-like protein
VAKPSVTDERASEVLAANRAFYRAFRDRDTGAMERLWAEGVELVCVHPGWEALTRRRDIIESWRGILESPDSPPIRCQEESVRFVADTALVVCVEMIGERALVATNLFVRENDTWRMALHHATPTARAPATRRAPEAKTVH